jgi:hypothetical protein
MEKCPDRDEARPKRRVALDARGPWPLGYEIMTCVTEPGPVGSVGWHRAGLPQNGDAAVSQAAQNDAVEGWRGRVTRLGRPGHCNTP